ncbi:hypothetical protein F183_A14080 [Bryobacterales bacterium F-183]|nr:hypothetical protein F183_A14080 [Bryobacterales bacterium F-183]
MLVLTLMASSALLAVQSLTPEVASRLAELPLHCIQQEYPNKTAHTIEGEPDARLSPRQLHPSFYGCFDWHSSVHGHWMLVRLLKSVKGLAKEQEIRKVLATSFDPKSLAGEVRYFRDYKLSKTFERTYGWAWLLKLDEELRTWDDPQGREWAQSMRPLTDLIVNLWSAYLPKQTYPNRTGVHPNTAFGLVFALDWARSAKDTKFEAQIVQRAKDYYLKSTAVTAIQEPDGTDFLSPSLEVADLMRRVLPQADFAKWFDGYITPAGLANLLKAPEVSDRSDYQIVHLDGLSLSRAWCLYGLSTALPPKQSTTLRTAAAKLLETALPHVTGGNYGGEHWLASFAVYALSQAR